MMALIDKYEHALNPATVGSLFKSVVSSMYENILDDDPFHKDLLKLILFCLKKVTAEQKHYFEINFQQEGLYHLILTEVLERSEIKNYAKQVVKNTLLEIAKVDHLIDFRQTEEESMIAEKSSLIKLSAKESSRSQNESPIKANRISNPGVDKKSKLKVYSEGLRVYDEKLRRGSVVKRKYKNCASE
jgi:hypothetical protein